ncbi:hypothetical protein OH779_35790 [Actinacidiphila glaucinigra]|uniref:hypothetical protein n=1 Tax=Actinacidiphila glaucinigra TaxID=235986 RepID=UPI00386B5A27
MARAWAPGPVAFSAVLREAAPSYSRASRSPNFSGSRAPASRERADTLRANSVL